MNHFFAPSHPSLEELPMKSFLRVLFILALFCGVSSFAHAAEIDFHAQVLDPTCVTNPDAACTLLPADTGVPFPINLTANTCDVQSQLGHIPSGILPADGNYGCFVGTNNTGVPITSISVTFAAGPLGGAGCDTQIPDGAFSNASCTPPNPGDPNPVYALSFTGGAILNTGAFILIETGLPAGDFVGTGVVNTPEPDSLLLFSTGVMMMAGGLFMKRRSFAFMKK
jgi:type 1 fimbria pilin